MQPFDLSKCPLEDVNLIEASAGTGKTYALAGLFVRCLIEKKYSVRQILVITFTNAATLELKSRIRRIISEAKTAFVTGHASSRFLEELLGKHPDISERQRIARLLNEALNDFDEACIYTIHGFCQRILSDHAFDSGALFDMEFISDQKSLEKEFVEDFWRKHFYQNHPALIRYALDQNYNRNTFHDLLKLVLTRPDIRIIPDRVLFDQDNLEHLLDSLQKKYNLLRDAWINQKDQVTERLKDKALNGKIYGNRVDGLIREIRQVIQSADAPVPVPASLIKISADYLREKTNKNQKTPGHELFDLCQELCNMAQQATGMMNHYLLGLRKEFLETARDEFPGLKKKKNVVYFDDLLTRAHAAICSPEGRGLAGMLRSHYQAVMVDEFQDTDPIQYAILQAIFIPENSKQGHPVFYIGDPKQSIYSFRGADIHAYLRAEKHVDCRYTMAYNWRSEQTLINGLNTLFGRAEKPFVYDDIAYHPVSAPEEKKTKVLRIEGEVSAGLHWWFLPSEDDEKQMGVIEARRRIMEAVVDEIAGLLQAGRDSKAFIGDEKLSAGDIAILVRKNSEAVAFKKALTRAAVPSVIYSSESVFSSDEAHDLRRIMLGILHHGEEGYLLSALATPFFEMNANDIERCVRESDQLEDVRIQFKHLRELWQEKGFLTMFLELLETEGIRERIARRIDGERRLTNYCHLAQLLFQMQLGNNSQPSDLLARLNEQCANPDSTAEEQQQRLETDRQCIRIVTVHKSKGLEYPIVFCPFAWEKGRTPDKDEPLCFHDIQRNWQAVADLGSEDREIHRQRAEEEILAEDCRLLYVALTRAKNRCYLAWGNIKDTRYGALGHLVLHQGQPAESDAMTNDRMILSMTHYADAAPGDISLSTLKQGTKTKRYEPAKELFLLSYKDFRGRIDSTWKIASYSYLSKAGLDDIEWDEESQAFYPDVSDDQQKDDHILFFPPGATSGTLLHEIIEKTDFTSIREGVMEGVISETLEQYHYDPKWNKPIDDMLCRLARTRLNFHEGKSFCLSEIALQSKRKEMEFYFPINAFSSAQMMSVLDQQRGIARVGQKVRKKRKLIFPVLKGFLKGFIDMVFEYQGRYYLADWKSNDLGKHHENYIQENLELEIYESFYDLQYLIYTLALDQHLRNKLPGYSYQEHFGGVYYFFLRGLPSTGNAANGIYYDRPDESLIRKLGQLLMDIR